MYKRGVNERKKVDLFTVKYTYICTCYFVTASKLIYLYLFAMHANNAINPNRMGGGETAESLAMRHKI